MYNSNITKGHTSTLLWGGGELVSMQNESFMGETQTTVNRCMVTCMGVVAK